MERIGGREGMMVTLILFSSRVCVCVVCVFETMISIHRDEISSSVASFIPSSQLLQNNYREGQKDLQMRGMKLQM